MKLSTKIILGYALIILLMVATLLYELSLVHAMQRINRELSLMKSRATEYSLQYQEIRRVDEFTRKTFVTGDPGYLARVREERRLFAEKLAAIQRSGPTDPEKAELEKMSTLWADFSDLARAAEERLPLPDQESEQWLSSHMAPLFAQMDRVVEANQRAIDAEIRRSATAGQKAEFVSQMAAVIAVALSFLVSLVIVRSISRSLEQLTHGARAVASGQFSYRLDASGNDNFSQVARDFNFMASRLDELDQLKRDYVSHVSHELKAPLASIQETGRILLRGIPGPLNEKQARLVDLSLQAGERLRRTILSLLDLSRMEANAFDYEIERRDLRVVIQNALKEFEVRLAEKKRPLDLRLPEGPLWVDCDSDRMGQVLSNLIDNALKFSPPESPIVVTARAVSEAPVTAPASCGRQLSDRETGCAFLSVADRGRGVPDAHKEPIFEKYHQVKLGKRLTGQGVGLGLLICRNIVAAHGGAIWVEDNPGGGSVFLVLLPRSRHSAGSQASAARRDQQDTSAEVAPTKTQ
jgi:two-component system sensor histidine kinase GlrK